MLHKAIIPAAGLGTRMLPAAKAIPKEMLPIVDRPAIQHIVEEAAAAGIDDLLLVTSPEKRAIVDHFRPNAKLDQRLQSTHRENLLASLRDLVSKVAIHSVDQAEQLGLGHAVLQAQAHVGSEPFLCLLGDAVFSGSPSPSHQLLEAHAELGGTIVGLEEVPPAKVSSYGIVGGKFVAPGLIKVNALVEKPSFAEAPTRLAIAARYVLSPTIFECLQRTSPGKGGEIQLTDALRLLLQREPIHGVILAARRHDIGNPVDWLKTNLLFAQCDPALWQQLAPLLVSPPVPFRPPLLSSPPPPSSFPHPLAGEGKGGGE